MYFGEDALDMWFVYEANFAREVKSIITDGIQATELQLRPVYFECMPDQVYWAPDGAYIFFARWSAIVFITIMCARGGYRLPSWLNADLSSLHATHTPKVNDSDRALKCLKATVLASKQNRQADPVMIDHMISSLGFTSEPQATQFIEKYNSMVGYDESLILKGNAARRQTCLLDPKKCTPEMKQVLRDACEKAENFDDTGITLDMMSLPEFWVGHIWVPTSHPQWQSNCKTSPESCLAMLTFALRTASAGSRMTSSKFRDKARRIGFFMRLCNGIFRRKGISLAVLGRYAAMVEDGTYDEDLDSQILSCDEDVGNTENDMDKYLADSCALVQDVIESQEAVGTSQDDEANARAEAAVDMDDAEWWLAECNHDVQVFRKARAERTRRSSSLKAKEDEYKHIADNNVAEATSSFMSKHLPLAASEPGSDQFWVHLKAEVNNHRKAIAKEFQCDPKDVLLILFADMPGAERASPRENCGRESRE